MQYDISLVWTSSIRRYINFDSIESEFAAVKQYEGIRRQFLREHGIELPVPRPDEWTCTLLLDGEQSLGVTFISELAADALQKQLEHALVPAFTDRVEVKPARFPKPRAVGVRESSDLLVEQPLLSPNYEITLIWNSAPKHISFDPAAVKFSPLAGYEEIRRRQILEQGIVLPAPTPAGWTCFLTMDDVHYMHVKFFSELAPAALQKQLEVALVPAFVDELEVKAARLPVLNVVSSS